MIFPYFPIFSIHCPIENGDSHSIQNFGFPKLDNPYDTASCWLYLRYNSISSLYPHKYTKHIPNMLRHILLKMLNKWHQTIVKIHIFLNFPEDFPIFPVDAGGLWPETSWNVDAALLPESWLWRAAGGEKYMGNSGGDFFSPIQRIGYPKTTWNGMIPRPTISILRSKSTIFRSKKDEKRMWIPNLWVHFFSLSEKPS